ncbi:MAG: DUF3048 domain-containing protein [Acetobacter sp.]|nr:DUF3048 domain-containing protein [Bacteroides sp.]MCM1340273.1 DUF3048 domain-containing protein [Acetobacter sp.]MCM1432777.1 DUF3048 domain-containing protein [Clostridiales bacterium]
MSDNNEIDDIIKEIRNKNKQIDRKESYEDFYTNSDSSSKRTEEPELTFTFEKEEPNTSEPETDEVFIEKEIVKPAEEIDSITIDRDKPVEESFDASGVIGTIDDTPSEYQNEVLADIDDYEEADEMKGKSKKKIIIIAAVILVVVIAVIVAVIAIKGNGKEEPSTTASTTTSTTTEAPVVITNPLTGEEGYNASAVDVRPVACVVENSYYARPQWGIDDKKSPDIILEGEVEGGETRMLWFYADYTNVPEQIGPMRSARPPFIRFSEMFDAIFIHWGQSSSKGNYVGANTVFKQDDVDHINQMTSSNVSYLFSRDSSRNSYGVEHTGVLNGDKLAQAIKDKGFRTEAGNRYTKFNFNAKDQKVSDTPCNTLGLTFSSRSSTRDWKYSAEDKMYHTEDFSNSNIGFSDVARKNLLVLFDNTNYVVKENYKGSGKSETYCDYGLSGGNGKLASLGTVIDITWTVENGMLVVKDENGKAISLNPGKTWIGWGSKNNNGSVAIG